MTVVRHYGKLDFFVTFTTNPGWKEIKEALNPGEQPTDRPDLCSRVFKFKYDSLMNDLLHHQYLGQVNAHSATIKWQKRGLSRAHIITDEQSKPRQPQQIDHIVSAEIPCKTTNPDLFEIITTSMVHGPCGALNMNSPCMEGHGRERHCAKGFPKPFVQYTHVREDAFPQYRRRSPAMGGYTFTTIVQGNEVTVDNAYVVPYYPLLSLRYNAHVNCEIVHSVEAAKYLYKYITKGSDRVVFTVRKGQPDQQRGHDEVETFINARYISASEAFWRIYQFPIHNRKPAIEKLPCHLPNEQTVIFEESEAGNVADEGPPTTKLVDYFLLNQQDAQARTILYPDIPHFYTWNARKTHVGTTQARYQQC